MSLMAGHYTDDDLVLYYYGEARGAHRIERHLQACASCAARHRDLSATLDAIGTSVPERDERYGLEVWQRIRHALPTPVPAPWWALAWTTPRLAALAALAALVLAAFAGGRYLRGGGEAPPAQPAQAAHALESVADRARFAAIGDHLERSERVLLDVVNAPGGSVEIGDQQRGARELLDANRLYRESAAQAGDEDIALVLDDLERTLLDFVHEPSTLTRAELDALERRLDAAALLFKVRVLADDLREREQAPASARAQGTTT